MSEFMLENEFDSKEENLEREGREVYLETVKSLSARLKKANSFSSDKIKSLFNPCERLISNIWRSK